MNWLLRYVLLFGWMLIAVFWVGCSDPVASAALELTNDTSYEWNYLALHPTSADNWGANQLAGDSLEVGETVVLRFIEPGEYDLNGGYAEVDDLGEVVVDWCFDRYGLVFKQAEFLYITITELNDCLDSP